MIVSLRFLWEEFRAYRFFRLRLLFGLFGHVGLNFGQRFKDFLKREFFFRLFFWRFDWFVGFLRLDFGQRFKDAIIGQLGDFLFRFFLRK